MNYLRGRFGPSVTSRAGGPCWGVRVCGVAAVLTLTSVAVAEERAEGRAPERETSSGFSQAIGRFEMRLPTAAEFFARRPMELWALSAAAAPDDEQTEQGGAAPPAAAPIVAPPAAAPIVTPIPPATPDAAAQAFPLQTPGATAPELAISADLAQQPLEDESLHPRSERAAILRSAMTAAMSRAAAASAASLGSAETIFRSSNELSRFQPIGRGGLGGGLGDLGTQIAGVRGLRISSASLFTGISSNAAPRSGFRALRNFDLGADYDVGARATLSYGRHWRRSSFRADYTPSQVVRGRYPEWNSTNHDLSLNFHSQISRRWDAAFTTSASHSGMEQFWLEAPTLRQVENPPANLDDLFEAVERGELTDQEFASVLTGSPIVEEPSKRNFDLGRVLSYQGMTRFRYLQSPRLSYSFGAGYNGSQLSNDPRTSDIGGFGVRRLDSRSLNGGFEYRLNRTIDVGARHSASWMNSSLYSNTVQQSSAHWSQRLTRYLSYSVRAGGGVVNADATDAARMRMVGLDSDSGYSSYSYIYGADLSYRRREHLFTASVDRRLGDSIGLGVRSSFVYGGQWRWAPLRADWAFRAGGSRNLLAGGRISNGSDGVASLDALLFYAGLDRSLAPSTALSTTYYFGRYDSPLQGIFSNIAVHRLQVALLWRPVEGR